MSENRNERTAEISRKTGETSVRVKLSLDRRPEGGIISTGLAFFDHMLQQIARHANFDLSIQAAGDLDVDSHHTVEDVGIALGQAFREALGDKTGVRRYGHARIPLDEALADVVTDLSGRPFLFFRACFTAERIGTFETQTIREFFRAFAMNAGITLHAELVRGENTHHQAECLFKALARSLREAVSPDPGIRGIPSSKGVL